MSYQVIIRSSMQKRVTGNSPRKTGVIIGLLTKSGKRYPKKTQDRGFNGDRGRVSPIEPKWTRDMLFFSDPRRLFFFVLATTRVRAGSLE